MSLHQKPSLLRAKKLYHQLQLEDSFEILNSFFSDLSIEQAVEHDEAFSIYIRVLYELEKTELLLSYQNRLKGSSNSGKSVELEYQLAMSHLSDDLRQIEHAKKSFESLLFKTQDKNLLARIKIALSTCYDFLEGDWRICQSIIDSIDTEELNTYLLDLVSIWRAKLLRDSGELSEAELLLGKILAKVKSEYHWHAYLSAKVILGGVYFKQDRFNQLIDVIKEVKAYCDHYPLRTIKRQIEYLADQIKGQKPSTTLVWQHSSRQSILRYEDRTLSLSEEKPWQKLILYLIREKIIPKKDIIKKLYRREYRSKKDDKLIYGQLNLVKRNLLKLGLSEKTITREPFGYRWIPEVAEVREDSL